MTLQSPGSILLQLGPITIRYYSILIALAFLCATWFATRLAKKVAIDPEEIVNGALVSFVGGIFGARLYYVILSWSYFHDHISEIAATWHGGLSIHGGIIGATIAGAIYCRRAHLPILRLCDTLAAVVPLGQAIGRWGNFFNSELFGLPVSDNFPLKLYIAPEHRPSLYAGYSFFHPTFLYESVYDLLLFLILYYLVIKRTARYPGLTFLIYVAGYSIGRLLIEPWRTDSIMFHGMQVPVIASAISLVLSLIAIGFLTDYYKRKKES